MNGLNLRLVEYFVVVAEELHFGRAAERLHIAQPSLSQQIKRLERELGVELLVRTTRNVSLTTAGEALLTDGRRLLEMAQETIRNCRRAGRESIVVGFGGSAGGNVMAEALRIFAERYPDVTVTLRELRLDGAEAIRSGDVDLALTRLEPGLPDIHVEVLSSESRVIALPRQHPLASRETTCFAELGHDAFIGYPVFAGAGPSASWVAEQQRHGLSGRAVAEATSIQEILTLVSVGRGICLLPKSVANMYPRPEISYVPMTDAEPAILSVAWEPRRMRPVVDAFLRTIRAAAAHRDIEQPVA